MSIYKARAPNYMLKEAHDELPAGAFVCFVSAKFLPWHIKEQLSPWFDPEKDAPCFTSQGFKVIPWFKIAVTY